MSTHDSSKDSSPDLDNVVDDLLAELAEDFARRYRSGEKPAIDEYIASHPFLADEIREVFPALVAMEHGGHAPDPAPIPVRAGATIGPYKLLERIGEGGFGAVFMAEQKFPVRRRVAIKLIKPGMDTRQVIARFEAERQALAMMDHPNIAKVLDGGTTEQGYPFFVMELVKGIPLMQYCDERKLAIPERLSLFVQICRAVQHAHQKGIIHRDLKPGNILVTEMDGRPLPKVIDFGLAKALQGAQTLTEHTLYTVFGGMVGTPLYMAPEQVAINALDVDTRTDIYALGVILYELLTGTTPLESKRLKEAAWEEVRRLIREEDAPRPSTRLSTSATLQNIAASRHCEPDKLAKVVRGELDWIVMKALEKDRSRRYDTANGLARDVERYLNDDPVEACPPSRMYRLRKLARRNRGVLLGAGCVAAMLMVLVAGLAVSNIMISAERNQKAQALEDREAALALAQAESQRAEDNFRRANITISEVLTKGALGSGEWSALPPELRKRFAEEAEKFYESLAEQVGDDPNLLYEAAVGYRAMGSLRVGYGETQKAEDSFRRSIAILDQIVAEHPDTQKFRNQLAWSCYSLGSMLRRSGRLEEAQSVLEKSARLYDTLLHQEPTSPGYRNEATICYQLLSRVWLERAEFSRAEQALQRAIAIREDPLGRPADASAFEEQCGGLYLSLGELLRGKGQTAEAKAAIRAAAQRYEDAASSRQTAGLLYHWALCYQTLIEMSSNHPQSSAEAEEAYRKFLEVQSLTPDSLEFHRDLRGRFGHVYRHWGGHLRSAGRLEEAEKAYFEAAVLFSSLSTDANYMEFAEDSHRQRTSVLHALGRHQEADAQLRRLIELYEQNLTPLDASAEDVQPDQLKAHIAFADLLLRAGHVDEALAKYTELIALRPDMVQPWNGRAHSYAALGEFEKAEQDYSRAIELDPQAWWTWNSRALFYRQQNEPEKAKGDLASAARCARDPDAQNEMAWRLVADPDPSWRDPKLAVELAERAIAARPGDGAIWNTLGVARYRNGQWQDAVAALDKSMELRDGGDSNDWFFLAMCHRQLGDSDKARAWYDKAVEWMEEKQPQNGELIRFRAEAEELMGLKASGGR